MRPKLRLHRAMNAFMKRRQSRCFSASMLTQNHLRPGPPIIAVHSRSFSGKPRFCVSHAKIRCRCDGSAHTGISFMAQLRCTPLGATTITPSSSVKSCQWHATSMHARVLPERIAHSKARERLLMFSRSSASWCSHRARLNLLRVSLTDTLPPRRLAPLGLREMAAPRAPMVPRAVDLFGGCPPFALYLLGGAHEGQVERLLCVAAVTDK